MRRMRSFVAYTAVLVSLLACVLLSLNTNVHAQIVLQQQHPRSPLRAAATPAPTPSHHMSPQRNDNDQQRLMRRQTESYNSSYTELPTAAVTIDGQPSPTASNDPLLA